MKKITALILVLSIIAVFASGVSFGNEVREFTDDCGRTVEIPEEVSAIAVTGPLSQLYVLPLCADKLVGRSAAFSDGAAKYFDDSVLALPVLGQLHGGKGTMNLEALLAAAPQIVLDVGEGKDSLAFDFDLLSEQTGIPFIHIDATVETAPEAYRQLGELTGDSEKAEQLAQWCESCCSEVMDIMEKVDEDGARKSILYCLGDKGQNVLAEKSYHAETLNLVADNAAKLDNAVSSGMGNEVDMEQILLWNPEVIIFAPDSFYSGAADETLWQQLDAVKEGRYYETPFGPYGWLASPPSVQRYLGLIWLTDLLYPDYCTYDLKEAVTEYYSLFYGYDLTDADYAELMKNAG